MAVKFKIQHTIGALYVPGDVAKFDAAVEKDLIEREIAEKYEPKKPAAPAGAQQ